MVSNLVFRWPKPLFFMVLGAHGIYNYGMYLDLPVWVPNDSVTTGVNKNHPYRVFF